MKEIKGNIWGYYKRKTIAIVIPTNGSIKNNGDVVAGRGLAKEACEKIPNFQRLLGMQIFAWGNNIYQIKHNVFSFPVKKYWSNKADIKLIEKSCQQLVKLIFERGYKKCILPRVGCGNGRLRWKEVKPVLEKYFDDRFIVVRL